MNKVIALYTQAKETSTNRDDLASAQKNLGMAYYQIALKE